MRELIIGDADFRHYMNVKWGIDLLGRKGSRKARNAAMDPYYFWSPVNREDKSLYLHNDHQSVNY